MSPSETPSVTSPLGRTIKSVLDAVAAPERYPSGASFIAADLPSFDSHFRRAIGEDRAVVVVLPDGDELFVEPRTDTVGRLLRLGRRLLAGTGFTRLAATVRSRGAGPLIRSGARDEQSTCRLCGYRSQATTRTCTDSDATLSRVTRLRATLIAVHRAVPFPRSTQDST